MITLFISCKCPDTTSALEAFNKSNIEYELIDINENMKNLKRFLNFRDNSIFFNKVKKLNNVGVPCIMIDEGKEFYLFEEGMDLTFLENK